MFRGIEKENKHLKDEIYKIILQNKECEIIELL